MSDVTPTTPTQASVAAAEAVARKPFAHPPTAKGKAAKRPVPVGRAYISSSYNNTIVTFTDPKGDTLATASAGQVGFRGPKKSTPYAAGVIVRRAAERIADRGLREVQVFVKGVGPGREAAIRAINANGIAIMTIKDITPIPHNGCRPRRVRRV